MNNEIVAQEDQHLTAAVQDNEFDIAGLADFFAKERVVEQWLRQLYQIIERHREPNAADKQVWAQVLVGMLYVARNDYAAVLPPWCCLFPCGTQPLEQWLIQELSLQLRAEAVRVTVLPWTSRSDVVRFQSRPVEPVPISVRRQFRAVVAADVYSALGTRGRGDVPEW